MATPMRSIPHTHVRGTNDDAAYAPALRGLIFSREQSHANGEKDTYVLRPIEGCYFRGAFGHAPSVNNRIPRLVLKHS